MTKHIHKPPVFLFLVLILIPVVATSQQITLDSCRAAARENWPAFKKTVALSGQRNLIDKTLNKSYLPKLNLNGQATWQSEVVTFPEVPTMPDFFPEIPKDNYNVEFGIGQIIWDGGAIKSNKNLRYATNDIEVQKLNIETYRLMDKINRLYINYLYLKKNEAVINLSANEIKKNIKTLQSAVNNGMVLKSDLDNVLAEQLKLQKELIRLHSLQTNVITSLNLITGLKLDTSYRFMEPEPVLVSQSVRPGLRLMDAQINYAGASVSNFKTNRLPKFSAFGRAGYGRPGFDFMNTDMHGYLLVGAKFTWNIFDWNLYGRQKQNVLLQQQIIRDNKAVLQKQISMEEHQYLLEIDRYKKQLMIDKKIVELKQNIYKAAQSSMKNGTITSTDYLKQFNEWKRAKLNTELDRLKLMAAQLNYNHARGKNYQEK